MLLLQGRHNASVTTCDENKKVSGLDNTLQRVCLGPGGDKLRLRCKYCLAPYRPRAMGPSGITAKRVVKLFAIDVGGREAL